MATKIKQTGISDDAVGAGQIASSAVGTSEIADESVAAADIAPDAVGASEIAAGAVGTSEIADGSVAVADLEAAARPALTKSFESTQQTITAGGALTLAHGLGVKPKLIFAVLVCTVADLNYTIGDEVALNPSVSTEASLDAGIALIPDATNISVKFGNNANSLSLINKTNGNCTQIVNSSWRLIVRAWA